MRPPGAGWGGPCSSWCTGWTPCPAERWGSVRLCSLAKHAVQEVLLVVQAAGMIRMYEVNNTEWKQQYLRQEYPHDTTSNLTFLQCNLIRKLHSVVYWQWHLLVVQERKSIFLVTEMLTSYDTLERRVDKITEMVGFDSIILSLNWFTKSHSANPS